MPGRNCSVCSHEDSVLINEALVLEGLSNRAITRQFGVSKDAIRRHREHIPHLLVKALEVEEAAQADKLLNEVRDLQTRTLAILERAEEGQEDERALRAVREARENLKLLGNLAGLIQEGTTINLSVHPEFVEFKTLVLTSLEPYREARHALLDALKRSKTLSNGQAGG